MKKFLKFIKEKWLIDTAKTVCLVLILLAAFIGINVLVQKLDLTDIDITENKLYTLSEESIKQVENIDKDVLIYFFGFEENEKTTDLAKQYSKVNSNINIESIKIIDRPDLTEKYGIEDGDSAIVIESEGRNKILTTEDLYTFDYTTYEEIDLTEQKLTNAILDVTADTKPVIYFLTGHGEYTLDSHMTILSVYLGNEVNDVNSLDLLVTGKVPEDTSVLMICSPTEDFTDFETEKIIDYINNGGKIIYLNDSTFEDDLTNVQKILDLFGMSFDNKGVIIEEDTNKMVMQTPNLIIPNISYSGITKEISTDGGIALLNASRINFKDEAEIEELNLNIEEMIVSSKTAFYRNNLSLTTSSKTDRDETGEFTIGAIINKQIDENTNASLIAFANNSFATDYQITIGSQNIPCIYLYNNKDLILNTVSYLTDKEDRITIRKDTGSVTYAVTEAQDKLIRAIIFGVPIILIAAGIIVWQERRRKK